jgi:hypothetical protein
MARTPARGVKSWCFETSMPTLHVALQEGFADDCVVLRVNDREVARREGVSTKNQIGLAATVDVDVASGPVELDVEVVTQHVAGRQKVDALATPYVGVSILGGALTLQPQGEPFRYL